MYDSRKDVWYNPAIEYLFNTEITEYDIKDAGFSIIQQYKLLPDETIQKLKNIPKGEARHKMVGILQRDDKEFAKNLSQKFGEVRYLFINCNNINPDNDIVSVKKDAIFLTKQIQRTKFGLIEFRPKNYYSSYLRFSNVSNLELYYNDTGIEIKGMSDRSKNRHRLYMYEFMKTFISYMEGKNPSIKRYFIDFLMKYKAGTLDEEYYLEFNNLSRDINPIFNYQNIIIPLISIIQKEIQ